MRRINLRRCFVALAIHSLFVCVIACADAGSIPEPVPEPLPEPIVEAPYLEVSPAALHFDIAGNALNAKGFAVESNCAWRLTVPEDADWLKASATSGEGPATVSFQLFVDTVYHAAALTFSTESADGQTVLSHSVMVRQGTEPSGQDNPEEKPSEPSGPDDPNKPTDPDGSGDDPAPSNPDDLKEDPNPDTLPPSEPAVPHISSVSPASLLWEASDCAVSKTVTVEVSNFENQVLETSIGGPNGDRFETLSPVRDGLVVRVTNVGPNETDADFTASLVISVEGGNRIVVPLSQSKRDATPDDGTGGKDDGSGDSGGGKEDGSDENQTGGGDNGNTGGGDDKGDVSGGGFDDFSTLNPNSLYKEQVSTPAGWIGEHCAVYSGGGSFSDPYFPELLGMDAKVRGLSMSGNTASVGTILSPELQGGCGTLTFDYGVTNEGDTQVDFRVDIQQNGVSVKTFYVNKTVEPFEKNTFTTEVHVAGPFRIVFTNNCPSKQPIAIDRYTIFHVRWTGEKR